MPQTTRMNLRYPAGTDTPDVVRDLGYLTSDLEVMMPRLAAFDPGQAGVMNAGDLKVTAGAGMTVNVAAGIAAVPDQTDTYAALTPVWRAALNGVVVTAANGTNPRIDQVVIDADGNLSVLAGVATAGTTLDLRTGAAALPNGYLRLADILVPAASVSVAAGNIRDRRPWARGASYVVHDTSGDQSSASASNVAITGSTNGVRFETGGGVLDIGLIGQGVNSVADYFNLTSTIDGSGIVQGWRFGVRLAAQYEAFNFRVPLAGIAAGSHVFQGLMAAGGGGTITLAKRAGAALTLVIREIIGQNANNT